MGITNIKTERKLTEEDFIELLNLAIGLSLQLHAELKRLADMGFEPLDETVMIYEEAQRYFGS